MIQFIELVPELVANPDYKAEHEEFIQRDMAGMFAIPPQQEVVRHQNIELGITVQAELKLGELVHIDGNKFLVQVIGPKEFNIRGNMNQKIYVLRQ